MTCDFKTKCLKYDTTESIKTFIKNEKTVKDNLTIHLGLPRTGTTFLQENVFPNIKNVHFLHRAVPSNIRNILGYKVIKGKINLISDELYTINNYSNVIETGPYIIADRIHKIFPDAKIIVVFRNKNKWKKSLYNRYTKETKNSKPYTFNEWEKKVLSDFDFKKYENYIKILFNKVLILKYEDLKKSHESFIKKMCDFIGCDVPDYKLEIVNKSLSRKQLQFLSLIRYSRIPLCVRDFICTAIMHIFNDISLKNEN